MDIPPTFNRIFEVSQKPNSQSIATRYPFRLLSAYGVPKFKIVTEEELKRRLSNTEDGWTERSGMPANDRSSHLIEAFHAKATYGRRVFVLSGVRVRNLR
jgi:hypothetical protein